MFKTLGRFSFWLILLFSGRSLAQLSGTYNVPGTYTSIAAAINALNTQGISGPVIIQINAGYTETAPSGGYSLTASGNAINTITFIKNGSGANPLISAYGGGTATPASAIQDGVWRLIGCDYVIIDGIDVQDLNTTNPSTMEYGIGFFKTSTSDGCQNNQVRNCVITLNKINNASGSGPAADGSRGINVVNSLANSQTSALTPISFNGSHSNNLFYGNTIQNCNVGISVIGYAAPSPYTLADRGNDIGGNGISTGNTILNFGGASAATNPAAGIRTLAQYDLKVAYNTINNNNGSGANHVNVLRGIYTNAAAGANTSIQANTLTINSGAVTSAVAAIENLSGATANNNTVSISSNFISNSSSTLNTSGSFYGIYNNGASAFYVEIVNNTINNLSTTSSTGNNYLIYNTGAATGSIALNNNSVLNYTNQASSSGAFYGVFNNVPASALLNISSNTFSNCLTNASTGVTQYLYNSSAISNSISLSLNSIINCRNILTSSGAFYGIFNGGTSLGLDMSLNSYNGHTLTATSSPAHLLYNTAAVNGPLKFNGNGFSNCTGSITAGGSYYGIYNNAASAGVFEANTNLFSANTIATTTGSIHAIYNRGTATNTYVSVSYTNNTISNCTFSASSNGPVLGIYNVGVTSGDLNMSNNTVTGNNWLTTTSTRYLICNTGIVNNALALNANIISNNSNTVNTTGVFNGILNTGNVTSFLTINNNSFTNNYNQATSGGAYYIYNSGQLAAGAITATNNVISSNTNSASGAADFYGIYNQGTTYSTLNMSNNTFTSNTLTAFTGATNLMYNTGAVTTSITSISFNNNTVGSLSVTVNSSGSFYGIYNNSASGVNLNIANNTFTNVVATASTGATHFIYNRGTVTNTFSSIGISNNIINSCTNNSAANGAFYTLWNNGVTSTLTTIANNTITNINWATATGLRYLISNWGVATTSAIISNNLLSGHTHTSNSTGSLYYIYSNNNTSASSGALSVLNNTITNNQSTASSGETHLINTSGVTSNTYNAISIQNNLLSAYVASISAAGPFYGIYNNTSSSNDISFTGNTFSNNIVNGTNGANYFIYNRGVAGSILTSITFTNNLFTSNTSSLSSNGSWFGLVNSGAGTTSSNTLTINNNTLSSTQFSYTTASINIINNSCPTANKIQISNNTISDITNTLTTTGNFFGINNAGASSGGDLVISNNVFTSLNSAASTGNKYIVYNNGGITNSISIIGNSFATSTHSISGTGSFHGIYNNSSSQTFYVGILSNAFNNNACYAATGTTFLYINSGVASNTLSNVQITNNSVTNFTSSATSGPFYGIYNSGFTSTDLTIGSNTLSNIVSQALTNARQLVYNNGRVLNSISINGNILSNYSATLNTSGAFIGIGNAVSFASGNFPGSLSIANNNLQNIDLTSSNGAITFVSNSGVTTNTILNAVIANNLVSSINASISSGGGFSGINNTSIASGTLSINSNSLLNVNCTSTTSSRTMLSNGGLSGVINFSSNLISGVTSTANTTASYFAISNSGNASADLNYLGNTVTNHTVTSSTGSFYPIYNTGGITGSVNAVSNLISNISSSASTAGGFLGVFNNAGSSSALNISSNSFINIQLNTSTGSTHFLYNRAAVTNTIANISVSNNLVNTVSLTTNSGLFYGFFNNGSSFSNLSVSSNTFLNIATTATSNARYFFNNTGVGSNGITFTLNTVNGFTSSANTTGIFYGIYNPSNCGGNLDIGGNSFNSLLLGSTTGAAYMTNNSGIITGSTNIQNNSYSGITFTAISAPFYGIFNSGSSPANIAITGNALNNALVSTSTSIRYGIQNTANSLNSISLDNNSVNNYTSNLNTTAAFYGMYNTGNATNISLSGNTLNALLLGSTTGTNYMVYNTGALTGTANLNNNTLSNCTSTSSGVGTFYGIYNQASNSTNANLNGNTISNSSLSMPSTASYLVYNNAASSTVTINNISINGNTVNNVVKSSLSSPYYGIFNNLTSSSNLNINNNTFTNSAISATSGLTYLVYNTGSVSSAMNLNGNRVGACTSSLNSASDFYGVYNSAPCLGNTSMGSNAFQNNSIDGVSNTIMLVRNNASASSGLSMNSNTVTGCSNTSVTSGLFYGVWNSGSTPGPLTMSGNNVSNNSSNVSTGNVYLVYNSALSSNSIVMSNNQLGQVFTNNTTDYSGNIYGISNTGGNSSSTLTANSNTFSGFTYNGLSGTGNIYFINNTNNNSALDFSANVWSGLSINHSGNEYLMYNPTATQGVLTVNNNSTTGGYTRTGNAGSMYIYYANGTSAASSNQTFSGNNFANITATLQGTGSFYGFYTADGAISPYPKKQIFNNSISNVNYNGLGFFYGYFLDFLGDGNSLSGSSVNNNTLASVSYGGPVYGIQIGTNASPNFTTTVYANAIQSLNVSGSNSEVHAVQLAGTGSGLNFYKNKISDLSANGTLGGAEGITVSNAAITNIFNNVIGNINAPVSSYSNGVNGINVVGGSAVNLYYNTVYLNATSTGSFFGSSAILASANVSLNLRNNIFINNSTPSGTGLSCAYRRSASSLANYSASSNNNLFYAGIPSSSKLIYFDGTPYQNLPQFQNLVSPRDNASVFENTNFLSTNGSSTNFLHVDNTIPSLSESGAQNAAGIADDIDANIRQGNPGYPGTGTAPDIGADEYNQNLVPCSGVSSGTAIVPSTAVKCSGNEVYMMTSGQTQAGSIFYQWKVATSPGGPYTNVNGGTGGTGPAYNTATLNTGTYYYIMVSTCAANSQTIATNELTVSVNASPGSTASVINGTICAGETLSLTANSLTGTNYLWLGPNNFTSSLQNPLVSSVVANSSGTYSLYVSTSNCTSSPVFVNALVNATPPNFSLTPSAASLCIGSSQTITASLPITNPTLTTGTQAGQNAASGYPAPYSLYYGGQKMQMLVLANELAAAGFTIGSPINSIQFPVVSKGANWGTVVNSCQNFMVGMKSTTVASLVGFESSIVNVVAPVNYTPSVGYNNVHNFSAPFVWDGVSNLIIETVFSNSIVGTPANAVIQNNHSTGFLSTLVYRADNQSVVTIAAASNSNVNVGFVRPDFKLNGSPVGTYSWGPAAGLTVQNTQSVVANPTISTVYTTTLSNGSCISTASMSVSVILNPTISIATTANTVCSGNTATLTANGAATYTWFNGTSSSSVVVSPFGNTNYSVVGTNPACPNASNTIQLISAPALTLSALPHPAQLCEGQSSTLTVAGASTYTWTGGSNNDTIVVTPAITTSYTVSANSGPGCWASKAVNVKVNPLPLITISPPSVTVCPGDFLSMEAMGVLSFTWQPGNSNSPILMINPSQSTIYQVTGLDLNGCYNTASVSVIVDPCESVAEHQMTDAFKIYPNPSNGLVNLSFGTAAQRSVCIMNSMGQNVFECLLTESTEQINLGHLSKGIYFVVIGQNRNSTKHKLVIN